MPVYTSHPADYDPRKLAQRIREYRQRRGLTLQELSRSTTISTARLSQIENEHHVLDIRQALAIARSLGVPLDAFFPVDLVFPYQVVRHGQTNGSPPRELLLLRDTSGEREAPHNLYWPLADRFVGRHLEPLLGRILPSDSPRFCYHHESEFVFVLKGTVEFSLRTPQGPRREILARGDCVCFRSSVPHALRSLDAEPAETLHVLSGVTATTQGRDWRSPRAAAYVDGGAGTGDLNLALGREIALHRQAWGWSVQELARITGLKAWQIEQIERGRRSVPLDAMVKLARAFGLPVRDLVRDLQEDGPWYGIQRSADIRTLGARKRRAATDRPEAPTPNTFHSLAGGYQTRHMYPYLIKVRNMDNETLARHEHHGEEFLYVLEGQLEVTTYAEEREVREVLQPGDSVYLDSSVPHFVRGETRNPLSETSAMVLDVFWCPLGENYLFED
jgi:transcriptional regulator with XRE-family HTH domain